MNVVCVYMQIDIDIQIYRDIYRQIDIDIDKDRFKKEGHPVHIYF